jgi:hypothetical protein
VATLALLTSLTTLPSAAAHGPDPTLSGGLWSQNQRIEYRWRSGSEPPSAIKTAIKEAAGDITASKLSKAATFAYDSGGDSLVGYGTGATCGVNGLACFTRTPTDRFTIWLREQGHVFDWGSLRWCQMYSSPPNGCYDAETITLDELGHVEILNHHTNYSDNRDYEDAVVQTYSRTKPSDGWNMHVLGRCDVATLQREYDVPDTSTKYSTCLDIDTTLTLSASPTSVAYNHATLATALLKVAGLDSYGRLRGNPVSNRVVKLQRRAVGATTWTTVATMKPASTAGTYTLSVQLLASSELRAVFSSPSGEGLNGDTSGTVTVTTYGSGQGP